MLKQLKKKFFYILGYSVLNVSVSLLCKTIKINVHNFGYLRSHLENGKNVVAAFWHGSMLIPWFLFSKNNFGALVSQSKDGELLARLLKSWKYKIIRGSSSKGGKESLDAMINLLQHNYSIGITPDGPRGPVEKMKAGAVISAKKTGVPLVLVGIDYKNFIELKSWDRFKIPKPFSEATLVFSDLIFIDSEIDYDRTSEIISSSETLLNELTLEAKNN
jgi:hypothetical protein